MKKMTLQCEIEVYDQASDLPEALAALLAHAQRALPLSYSPYSHFQVGAAAHLASGAVVLGANQENAAYPLCLCAEQAVLGAVHTQHPGVAVTAMAITVHTPSQVVKTPAAPCGACRQVLSETEDRHRQPITLVLSGQEGPVYVLHSVKDLLPLSFNSSFL